ncbi:hypothetical protein MY4824_003880 [Beauveria thailandica]
MSSPNSRNAALIYSLQSNSGKHVIIHFTYPPILQPSSRHDCDAAYRPRRPASSTTPCSDSHRLRLWRLVLSTTTALLRHPRVDGSYPHHLAMPQTMCPVAAAIRPAYATPATTGCRAKPCATYASPMFRLANR